MQKKIEIISAFDVDNVPDSALTLLLTLSGTSVSFDDITGHGMVYNNRYRNEEWDFIFRSDGSIWLTRTDEFSNTIKPTQNQLKWQEIATGGAKRKVSAAASKKTSGKKATDKRVTVNGMKRVVYEGPRGGKYIKMRGEFVPLK